MRNEKGILTIEASIALTFFAFFILFFLSFGKVYRVQNIVAHATNQCAQALAVESYFRETFSGTNVGEAIITLSDVFGVPISTKDAYKSLGDVNLKGILKSRFATSLAETSADADEYLLSLGVKDGLNGISFSKSMVSNSEITVSVSYSLKLQFPFLGRDEIRLSKVSIAKAYKSIPGDNYVS